MPIDIKKALKVFDELVKSEKNSLEGKLSDLQLSALTSWVEDCHQSFNKIYNILLENIKNASPDEPDIVHDNVDDIHWELQHIKNHIMDSEEGFFELMKVLAEKSERDNETGPSKGDE